MDIAKAYRADTLYFHEDELHLEIDALVVIDSQQKIIVFGPYSKVQPTLTLQDQDRLQSLVQHFPNKILTAGFIDCHSHYPQVKVIGSPAEGLLPWLENYTFPEEAKFNSATYAASVARVYFDELARNGVTCALTFSTSHSESVEAVFQEAEKRKLRFITGRCLSDRNCPEGVRDATKQSLIETEQLIQRWHEKPNTRLGYAITPRFAPCCSDEQMHGAADLAKAYPSTWVQSHVAENVDEIAWATRLYPNARSYLQVYGDFGLMRKRAVYAHCIHLDNLDRQLLFDTQTAAAVCPTSNLFLGSGSFDFAQAKSGDHLFGLACDIGGGTSFSPFHTMLAAYYVARSNAFALTPSMLWHSHTLGAAKALDLQECIGNVQVGLEADLILLDPAATPLLALRTRAANSLDELLFALIVLGDDRVIASDLLH
jgi:guanine deaminase